MFLLDNNTFKLLVAGDEEIVTRVGENAGQIFLSSIACEEALVWHLNTINRARAPRTALSLPRAHEDFVQTLNSFKLLPILAYSDEADAIYKTFPASVIRIGSQDCRIAAQAMAHGLTVITRNLSDFEAIGAPCEDWIG